MLLYLLAIAMEQPPAEMPPLALSASAAPLQNLLKPQPVSCDKGNADEVVVCGSREERYRLHPMDEQKYAEAPIRAKKQFGPDTLDIGGKQATVGGFPSNRLMITFTVPF